MANNSLLEEFASPDSNEFKRTLTNLFDENLSSTDETAIQALKNQLDSILQERINASTEY